MNKKGIEASFAWIFAVIIGAAIIALAVYAATSLVNTEKNVQNSEAGAQLEVLLSPVETNLESDVKTYIIFPEETRVFNDCQYSGTFGSQGISVSVKSGVGTQWQVQGARTTIYNKYIFSPSTVQGRKANIFVQPFDMPFKVADLIFMWSQDDRYCFVNSPTQVEQDFGNLDFPGILMSNDSEGNDCINGSTRVCFGLGGGCGAGDIVVNYDGDVKTVTKNYRKMYFVGPLMYGAIFSDPSIYECQVKRLMKRASELSSLYFAKSDKLSSEGCASGMEGDLVSYINMTYSLNNSANLDVIESYSKSMEAKNAQLNCKLF